jgi:2,3-bisphosphoglycerate-independent phosphoglycerate mutase
VVGAPRERTPRERTPRERVPRERVRHARERPCRAAGTAVDVLAILDGASEPVRGSPTSLERARTHTLDGLVADGVLVRLRTVARALPAGSESAIPALLGWLPHGRVDRGAIEAAAHGIEVRDGERAWRVDRRDRADASATARALARVLAARATATACTSAERFGARAPIAGLRVHHLAGHRMLVVGPRLRGTLMDEIGERVPGAQLPQLLVWPAGAIPSRTVNEKTVMVGARGAAVGVARLMGARTVVPAGATGRPGTDLAAKAAAALAAIEEGAERVVVHVGAPDEAAHERDADAKVAAIEAADAQLLAPLADWLRSHGGTLRVCPDHGCDPATGEHDRAPVPCVDWPAPAGCRAARETREAPGHARRLTERAVAALAVTDVASIAERGRERAFAA